MPKIAIHLFYNAMNVFPYTGAFFLKMWYWIHLKSSPAVLITTLRVFFILKYLVADLLPLKTHASASLHCSRKNDFSDIQLSSMSSVNLNPQGGFATTIVRPGMTLS
mmetsp:Transcript_18170/g.27251  ORF Transcript_18170/g.27251 Transcript_18170/m.27251 type:complete len:107 (+) Transcript_18170:164-484(+)